MIPVAHARTRRDADRRAPEEGAVYVDRAAAAISHVIRTRHRPGSRVALFCGKGNNGADGIAAAFHLNRAGFACHVVVLAEPGELGRHFLSRLPRSVEISTHAPATADVVVDAVLGSGNTGEPRSWAATGIKQVRSMDADVVSVDVPSGFTSDWAVPSAEAVRPHATVCFGAVSSDLAVSTDGGDVWFADIGIEVPEPDAVILETPDIFAPRRTPAHHKYAGGFVGVIAGSQTMPGSAALVCDGAVAAGATYVGIDTEVFSTVVSRHPQVVARDDIESDSRVAAIVFGPGLGRSEDTVERLRRILNSAAPVVIDGDGLWALSKVGPGVLKSREAATVLTPHSGELQVLTDATGIGAAEQLCSETGSVVHMKGFRAVTFAPGFPPIVNLTNTPELSSAGTGDVLSGVIAALLASGLPAQHATATGAWLHGRAGQRFGRVAPADRLGDAVSQSWPGPVKRLPAVRRIV